MQDEPEQAANLWSFASRAMIEGGWRHAAAATLDKLLASACLLRDEVAGAAAVQLLCSAPRHVAAAFPALPDAPKQLHRCAWHALQHFCPPTDLDMSAALFVDVRKSQASLFFGEVNESSSAVLRPQAARVSTGDFAADGGAQKRAQLVGLAQHCEVTVCVTSRLPVKVRLASLALALQHVVRNVEVSDTSKVPVATGAAPAASRRQTQARAGDAPIAQHNATVAQAMSTAGASLRDDVSQSQGLSGGWREQTEDAASTASASARVKRSAAHRRAGSSWRAVAVPQSVSRDPSAMHQHTLSGMSEFATPEQVQPDASVAILRQWTDGYSLECPCSHGTPPDIPPGDTYLTFTACPMQEGVHLLDSIQAELEQPGGHSLFIEARSTCEHDDSTAASPVDEGSAEAVQALGAALVATAAEENIAVGSAVPGGALFEACCQWLGVRISRMRGDVRNLEIRTVLRAIDGDAPLEFARCQAAAMAEEKADDTGSAENERSASGGGKHSTAALHLGMPERAFWEAAGSCEEVAVGANGEVVVTGALQSEGILWLPVACRQQTRQLELVDIGDEGLSGGNADEEPSAAQRADACADVAVSYWSGCHRSKHVRLRVPVQPALSTHVVARPIGTDVLALQVTQTAHTPFALTVTQQQLGLQAGLTHDRNAFAGPPPPWTIAPHSTQLALYAASHNPAKSAANMSELVCRLQTAFCISQASVMQLAVVTYDAVGNPTAHVERSNVASAPQTGQNQPAHGSSLRHMPSEVARVALQGRPAHASGATRGDSRADSAQHSDEVLLAPSESMLRRTGAGGCASVCAHTHTFSVELSSFSAMALLSGGARARRVSDNAQASSAPIIAFMGPCGVKLGQDTALMWRVRWPQDDLPHDGLSGAHHSGSCSHCTTHCGTLMSANFVCGLALRWHVSQLVNCETWCCRVRRTERRGAAIAV